MVKRLTKAMREFFATEAAGGVALLVSAIIALVFANSPARHAYSEFWRPAQGFISEGLMSLFFFLVGLEIKREFLHGELRNPKSAALPIFAAIGGMITPALIFSAINHGGSGIHAWAVPMPTDIALSIGALALLGSKIDPAIKIFLLTLAIADDLGSLVVIAIFYSGGISPVRVLSTLGAVVLAWILPARPLPTERLIAFIHPWTSFVVIPVFVLANIGIEVDVHTFASEIKSPVALGIIIGRVLGKIIGITLFAWLAIKIGLARLPQALALKHIAGAGALGGMGLTVSLFIADLAINNQTQLSQIRLGLIVSALLSALIGLMMLRKFSTD